MREIWLALRGPRVSVALLLGLGGLAGFLMLAQAYEGLAALLVVPKQIPFLVSGAIGGLAVTATSLMALKVHLDRVESAQERRELADAQRAVLALVADLRAREQRD